MCDVFHYTVTFSYGSSHPLSDSLDFPNAPPGTIELIVTEALHSLGKSGVHAATFGGSAVSFRSHSVLHKKKDAKGVRAA